MSFKLFLHKNTLLEYDVTFIHCLSGAYDRCLNPLTPKILSEILIIVCHIIYVM